MILLIGGEKGGTGKSSLATNLAVWLAQEGKQTLLLDADLQATSYRWVGRRNQRSDNLPTVKCAQVSGDVYKVARGYAEQHEQVIIDAGGRDSKEFRTGLVAADLALFPVQASQADLETMDHVSDLVGQARKLNPQLMGFAVIFRAPTNPLVTDVRNAQEFLQGFHEFGLADTYIRERKIFRDAMLEGRGVVEMRNAQARAEIQLLAQEIYGSTS